MDEIREYESQLAEVVKELEKGENDELKQLETEIVSLIAELRSKLPKFNVGDAVSTKTMTGKVVDSIGSNMYKIQPYNTEGVSEGEPIVVHEKFLRAYSKSPDSSSIPSNKPTKSTNQNEQNKSTNTYGAEASAKDGHSSPKKPLSSAGKIEGDASSDKKYNEKQNEEQKDDLEQNKNKWKQFSKKSKSAMFANSSSNAGRVAKQAVVKKRAHFVPKR